MNHQTHGEQQSECVHYDGECLIDKHGGNPTPEQCEECMEYRGPTRGVGDQVAQMIQITKLDTLLKKSKKKSGEGGCNCGKRRASLNRRFPKNKD